MVRVLILEDDPNRVADFRRNYSDFDLCFVSTVQEAEDVVKAQPAFDVMFLDHDLGGTQMAPSDKNSGYEFARRLAIFHSSKLPKACVVHSLNPNGAENIVGAMGGNAIRIPFAWKQCVIKLT